MITMKCDSCGKEIELIEGGAVSLQCPYCGGGGVSFDRTIVRTCTECGDSEKVTVGKTVPAFHDKPRCKSYTWTLTSVGRPKVKKFEPEPVLDVVDEAELPAENDENVEATVKRARRRRRM